MVDVHDVVLAFAAALVTNAEVDGEAFGRRELLAVVVGVVGVGAVVCIRVSVGAVDFIPVGRAISVGVGDVGVAVAEVFLEVCRAVGFLVKISVRTVVGIEAVFLLPAVGDEVPSESGSAMSVRETSCSYSSRRPSPSVSRPSSCHSRGWEA